MLVRRKSTVLDVAKSRWQGMVSQNPEMDLGSGLNAAAYKASIEALEAKLMRVNNIAAENQTERAELRDMERELRDLNDRYFRGTAAKFGTSSSEYMAVGGTRKKDRRKSGLSDVSSPASDLSSEV
jgi:hypothetical protein